MTPYRYRLEQECVEFLCSCEDVEQQLLLVGLRRLAQQPYDSADHTMHGAGGRDFQIKFMGDFMITYVDDSPVRRLIVLEIARV